MRGMWAHKEKALSPKLEDNHVLHLLGIGMVIKLSKILFQATTSLL